MRIFITIFLLLLLQLAATAYAVDTHGIDFNSIMSNLSSNMPAVIKLTTATSYFLGFWFIIAGLKNLKKIGQSQGSSESTIGGQVVKVLIGAALVYLPSTLNAGVITLWGTPGLLDYPASNGLDPFYEAKRGAAVFVQAIGYISFVRGFVMLAKGAGQQQQQYGSHGMIGKGILHIIGGILAINIVATIQIVGNSVGIQIF